MSGEAQAVPAWRRTGVQLGALLLLQWIVQGAIVLGLGDVLFIAEAAEKAAGSKALIDGLDVPRHWLVYHDFEGGGFIVLNLVSLGFRLLGQTLLAGQLVAIAYCSLILAAGYLFCRDAFGSLAGVLFGLFFVFQPESFQKIALVFAGSHYQGVPYVPLMLWGTCRVVVDRDTRALTWFLFGIVLGIGVYFTYQNVPPALVAFVTVLWSRRRELVRPYALWGWAGLLVGMAPWLWMISRVGWGVFSVHGAGISDSVGETSIIEQQTEFLRSIYVGRSALDLVALVLIPLAPLAALFVRGDGRGRKVLVIVSSLALFAVLYFFAGFAVGKVTYFFWFSRASPFMIHGQLLMAAGVAALILHRGSAGRVAGMALGTLLLLSGVRDTALVLSEGRRDVGQNWELLTRTKGYQYVGYLMYIADHMPPDVAARAELLTAYDEPDPALLRWSIAADIWERKTPASEVAAWIATLPEEERRDYIVGLGSFWWHVRGRSLQTSADAVASAPPVLREHLFEAVGRYGVSWAATERHQRREIRIGLEQGWPDSYFRGLGYRLSRVRGTRRRFAYHEQGLLRPYIVDPVAAEVFLRDQEPRIQKLMHAGYEEALRDHTF